MDWFEKLTGFKEAEYETTRNQLELKGDQLLSRVNGRSYVIGTLELKSLHELRRNVVAADPDCSRLTFRNITGDVRALHQHDAFKGALFQVASQFNMLEMVDPSITTEQGVSRYDNDRTQGPACAIAAGAATIFRNYFAPVEGQIGQTSSKQLDGLTELGTGLANRLGRPVETLWTMRNGYALCSPDGLKAIGTYLRNASEADRDDLRSKLRIGVHTDVEVTEGKRGNQPRLVSQAFCSALPVAYSGIDSSLWQPFAELVLEAAYEATMLAAAISLGRGRSKTVLLTQLGGGAFGNDERWIKHAISRALTLMKPYELDVQLVSYGSIPKSMIEFEDNY